MYKDHFINNVTKYHALLKSAPKNIFFKQVEPFLDNYASDLTKRMPSIKTNTADFSELVFTHQLKTLNSIIEWLMVFSIKSPIDPDDERVWQNIISKLNQIEIAKTLPSSQEKIKIFCKNTYQEICDEIKTQRNKSYTPAQITDDYQKARVFFSTNPNARFCGKSDGTIFSYIKSPTQQIFKRDDTLGSGHYGRTKTGINIDTNEEIAIKRQLPSGYIWMYSGLDRKNLLNNWRLKLIKESQINLDLDVALTPIEFRLKNGEIYKAYQGMKKLGRSLSSHLGKAGKTDPIEKRIDYAVGLLLKVNDLHTGKAAKSGKRYAHCDIKPDNVCIDSQGKIHLIDFGVTHDNDFDVRHTTSKGTDLYMPYSFTEGDIPMPKTILETPSYFFDDKIATLRSIYHQGKDVYGILTKPQFESMPAYIQDILKSNDIRKCEAQNYSLQSIAAVLGYYRLNNNCSADEINFILSREDISRKIIDLFQRLNAVEKDQIRKLMVAGRLNFNVLLRGDIQSTLSDMTEVQQLISTPNLTPENIQKIKLVFMQGIFVFEKAEIIDFYTRGVITQFAICTKADYKYDFDIFKIENDFQYWRGVLQDPATPSSILLHFINDNTHERAGFLELIIDNYPCTIECLTAMLSKADITEPLKKKLIQKIFTSGVNNAGIKKIYLQYLLDTNYNLTDEDYKKIFENYAQIPDDLFSLLLLKANSSDKMKHLFLNSSSERQQTCINASRIDDEMMLALFELSPPEKEQDFYLQPQFIEKIDLKRLTEEKRQSFALYIKQNNIKLSSPIILQATNLNLIDNDCLFQWLQTFSQNDRVLIPLIDKIRNLDHRHQTQVSKHLMTLLIKIIDLKSRKTSTLEEIYLQIAPEMKTIEKHRGLFQNLMEWLRSCFKNSQSMDRYSIFNTRTENMVHQYVEASFNN